MDTLDPEILAIPVPDWCRWELFFGAPALYTYANTKHSAALIGTRFAWVNTDRTVTLRLSKGYYPPFPTTLDACKFIALQAWLS